jgi:hypothetical protein
MTAATTARSWGTIMATKILEPVMNAGSLGPILSEMLGARMDAKSGAAPLPARRARLLVPALTANASANDEALAQGSLSSRN